MCTCSVVAHREHLTGLHPENVSSGGHTPTFDLGGGGLHNRCTQQLCRGGGGGARFIRPCAAKRGKKV